MRINEPFLTPYRAVQLAFSLVAAAMAPTTPLWADSQDVETEEIRKTHVIKVAGPRGHAVAHGHGIMGSRGYLGVEAVEMTPELRQHFGAPAESGVMISRVADGSPAQSAGLQVGDVLTAVDDEPISSFVDLFHQISGHEEGDAVRLEVLRDAQSLAFDATLAVRERAQIDIRQFRIGPGGEHHTVVVPEGEYDEVIELQAEAFDEAIDRLHEKLSSSDWEERIHSYNSSQAELLERLEALENRLRELEGELDE